MRKEYIPAYPRPILLSIFFLRLLLSEFLAKQLYNLGTLRACVGIQPASFCYPAVLSRLQTPDVFE